MKENTGLTAILIFMALCSGILLKGQDSKTEVYPGADENTPSLSQYFSWINNTNEGSTEAQTLEQSEIFQLAKSRIWYVAGYLCDQCRSHR